MTGSHYEALALAADCSQDAIRRAYHRAARQLHPDKQGHGATLAGGNGSDVAVQEAVFLRVQRAYEVLRDPQTRKDYDQELAREQLCRQRDVDDVRIAETVSLKQMRREEIVDDSEDEEDADVDVLYSHQCRCGGAYEITEEELLDEVDIVCCNGCSLNIRVVGKPSEHEVVVK